MDPFLERARSNKGLRLGRGGVEKLAALLRAADGQPCPYCRRPLSLSDMHVDHKTATNGAVAALRGITDRLDNLQACCRGCNRAKGTMSDAAFRRLLAFLRTDPELYAHLIPRLRTSVPAWRYVSRKKARASAG